MTTNTKCIFKGDIVHIKKTVYKTCRKYNMYIERFAIDFIADKEVIVLTSDYVQWVPSLHKSVPMMLIQPIYNPSLNLYIPLETINKKHLIIRGQTRFKLT